MTPQITANKRPIEADAYYTIAEITNRQSPWYVASASTIFRALRNGALIPNYVGRRVLLLGSAIHDFVRGGETQ